MVEKYLQQSQIEWDSVLSSQQALNTPWQDFRLSLSFSLQPINVLGVVKLESAHAQVLDRLIRRFETTGPLSWAGTGPAVLC